MTVLYLGLAVWLATLIVVESEIFRPLRDWLEYWSDNWQAVVEAYDFDECAPWRYRFFEGFFAKTHYLVGCDLCAGTWIALTVAALTDVRPVGSGFVGLVLAALAFKGIAHMALVVQKVGERWAR